mmetsp:Transcript_11918/g.39525  ORF Transcript_11918/g.39525 Transcript_11918/m.39525 type:complete len:107 (+) Transcript_11918:998-1318(+)
MLLGRARCWVLDSLPHFIKPALGGGRQAVHPGWARGASKDCEKASHQLRMPATHVCLFQCGAKKGVACSCKLPAVQRVAQISAPAFQGCDASNNEASLVPTHLATP